MSASYFVDSNIWLYAFMDATTPKHAMADALLTQSGIVLSTQVVNEVCSNLIRKAGYTETEIQQTLQNLQTNYPILDVSFASIQQASILRDKYRLSYWDSLILATAMAANCSVVYSEDMQHGLKIGNLSIINPFTPSLAWFFKILQPCEGWVSYLNSP